MAGALQTRLNQAIVSLQEVSHTYPARGSTPARQALRGVSLEVRPGETFGLLGPNGGGKSTLFRILSTYFVPTEGSVRLFGLDPAASAREIRRRIGVVFQSPSLDARLTAEENLLCQGRLYGIEENALRRRAAELLDRYGLLERRRDQAGTLSGGLKRRLELAKSLLHEPELLVLDEPSTGLDPGARRELWGHLRELKSSRGITVLLTTHLLEEADACDRLALLDRGAVAALGTPQELKAEIGGDVITIEAEEPALLARSIRERFGLEVSELAGRLRLEKAKGHAFIPQLAEAFPGLLRSVNLSRPTLEDVFIHHTGRRLWADGEPS